MQTRLCAGPRVCCDCDGRVYYGIATHWTSRSVAGASGASYIRVRHRI